MLKTKKVYTAIFAISFLIISLQIILCLLLDAIAYLPFLAISFAFFGLSVAGVRTFVRYYNKKIDDPPPSIAIQLLIGGAFIILTLVILNLYNQIALSFLEKVSISNQAGSLNYLRLHILFCSLLAGFLFSIFFFQFGVVASLIYKHHSDHCPKLYLFDLLGAASGGVLAIALLNLLQVGSILIILSTVSFLIAYYLSVNNLQEQLIKRISILFLLLSVVLLGGNLKYNILEIELNPHLLTGYSDSQELWSRWNAYSRTSLLKYRNASDEKYSYLFSLNLNSGRAQLTPFTPDDPYPYELYQDFTPAAMAFLLNQPQDILILFAGAGKDMLEAYSYSHGQSNITGVEINPLIVRKAVSLPEFRLKEFFAKKNVHMVVQEGRNFLEQSNQSYDAIILSYSGATTANHLGTSAYTGQYLYTKEAIKSYLQHLKPNGVIGIAHGGIRSLGIIKTALDEMGFSNAKNHILVMADKAYVERKKSPEDILNPFQENRVLIRDNAFTPEEVDRIGNHLGTMNHAWIYTPYYTHPNFQIYQSLLESLDPEKFMNAFSKTNHRDLTIATDDKPFIHNQFYLNSISQQNFSLKNFFQSSGKQYSLQIFLFWFLIIFIFVGFLFIIAPLGIIKNFKLTSNDVKILAYFAGLGLAFIFVEIAIIQKFTLLLGNPIYAFSVILSSLLVAAGVGSFLSDRYFEKKWLTIRKAAIAASAILLIYYFALSHIIATSLSAPLWERLMISIILIFPLGIILGMLFPQGLKRLYLFRADLIPWAWAFNGYMTLVGSLVSTYLSIATGFNIYFLISAFLYLTISFLKIKIFK